jgi:phosphatidylserine/phosphatidylglycerophosphate/cardiolipin synthase-like enzyme/uncharacterized membrane protein YdjX (TVP38/TMEM64 family)
MPFVPAGHTPLLVPGSTCWQKVGAHRLALIQDAGPAFSAIASAIEAARGTVFILGWDIDSRVVMRPSVSHPQEGLRLLPLLCQCLDRQPQLHVFVLVWDFSLIYLWEREPWPRKHFGKAHLRLHFALDGDHAMGASHHQKIVVVDDEVAFLGGIDLTLHRWDTPEHRPVDVRRVDSRGALYGPFHDVHAAVAGPAAAALGQLARERWNVGGSRPSPPEAVPLNQDSGAWPRELPVDAVNLEVALSRTFLHAGISPVKEIEALTTRAIARAERWIYAENQYLTSGVVRRALGQRLSEENGPEIVLILPEVESGWMEQSSMGILRTQVLAYLLRQDRFGRLRVLTPLVSDGQEIRRVSVHAKVLVVDDVLAKVGSSNFSSRSLGLDSECDLAVEASDAASTAFVASVRNRLLAEHLGISAVQVSQRLAECGSLCKLVDAPPLASKRRLIRTPTALDAPFDFAVLDGAMVDPPEPWSATLMLERAVPRPLRRGLARRWLRPLCWVAGVLVVLTTVRHWTPLAGSLHTWITDAALGIANTPVRVLVVVVCLTVAATAFVPITLLATTTLAVFGLWPGAAMAWISSVLSATLSHAIGSRLGPRVVAWLPERIESSVRRFLKRQAFWAVVFMRLLPIGNFGALNLVAGALKMPRRSFILGNMVGLLPGLFGLGIVVGRVVLLLRHPSLTNVFIAAAVVGGVTGLALFVKRRFRPAPSTTSIAASEVGSEVGSEEGSRPVPTRPEEPRAPL